MINILNYYILHTISHFSLYAISAFYGFLTRAACRLYTLVKNAVKAVFLYRLRCEIMYCCDFTKTVFINIIHKLKGT